MSLSPDRCIEKDIKKKFGDLGIYEKIKKIYFERPKCDDCYNNNELCKKCNFELLLIAVDIMKGEM